MKTEIKNNISKKMIYIAAERMLFDEFNNDCDDMILSDRYYEKKQAFLDGIIDDNEIESTDIEKKLLDTTNYVSNNGMDNTKVIRNTRKNRNTRNVTNINNPANFRKIIILSITLIICFSFVVHATVRIKNLFVNKINKYETNMLVDNVDEKIFDGYLKFEYEYIPEGMVLSDDNTKLTDINTGYGMTMILYKVNYNSSCNMKNITDIEEMTIDGREAYFLNRAKNYSNLFCYYKEYNMILCIFVHNEINIDEAINVIKGTKVIEVSENEESSYSYWNDYENHNKLYAIEEDNKVFDDVIVSNVGDEVVLNVDNITACIESVKVSDNSKELDGKYIRTEKFESYLNDDGTIKDIVRKKIIKGDGVNSIDAIIGEENVKQKIVIVTMLLNNCNQYYSMLPRMMYYIKTDDGYLYDVEYIDNFYEKTELKIDSMPFYIKTMNELGEYSTENISKVEFAYVVDDDILDEMVIDMSSILGDTETNDKKRIVDIMQ